MSEQTVDGIASNRHPAVMFEVLSPHPERARAFYRTVFDWTYDTGSTGFSYVHFPGSSPPLLGGIGQAANARGMEAGTNFYLLVDDVSEALDRVVKAGGEVLMPRTPADGYHFGMFTDLDGFAIGLIETFTQ